MTRLALGARNCGTDNMDFKLKAGDEAAEWITTFLNIQPYQLVHCETNMVSRKPSDLLPAFLPKDEDSWVDILIGTVKLKGKMSCPRCIFTAVDPDTGIMGENEILKALKSYRKCDPPEEHIYKSNPLFGWLYGTDEMGMLEVGDPVYKIIS